MSHLQLSIALNCFFTLVIFVAIVRNLFFRRGTVKLDLHGESISDAEKHAVMDTESQINESRQALEKVLDKLESLRNEKDQLEISVANLRRFGAPEYDVFWDNVPNDLKDAIKVHQK